MNTFEDELGFEILNNVYVTDKAEDIISELKIKYEELKNKEIIFNKTKFDDCFNEFWSLFPSTDKYLMFPKTRVLKVEQEKCKKLYKKALDKISHEDIIKALTYEIKMRENNSVMGKSFSDFKYMSSSSTWLNKEAYISILETMDENSIEKVDQFSKDV